MASDLTITGTGAAVTTFLVCLAVFVLAYLVDLGRRQRARERRRSAYAASWRTEYLVGHPLVPVGTWDHLPLYDLPLYGFRDQPCNLFMIDEATGVATALTSGTV